MGVHKPSGRPQGPTPHHPAALAPTILRIGLPSSYRIGTGLAPVLFSRPIRLFIAFANRVPCGCPGSYTVRSLPPETMHLPPSIKEVWVEM